MRLYRLEIYDGEDDADGKDLDEWFSSLRAARHRRRELIAKTPPDDYKYGENFAITEVVLAKKPMKQLALALLNRQACFSEQREVVPPHRPRGQLRLRGVR